MAKKQNKCSVCGEHIDKSAADHAWMTVSTKRYVVLDTSVEGYHWEKAEREQLCESCAANVRHQISEMKIAHITKKGVQ